MKWQIPCVLLLSACIPQSGEEEGTLNPPVYDPKDDTPPTLTVASAAASELNLGEEAGFDFTIVANSFSGTLTLTAAGAPASWQTTLSPATLDLAAGETANVHMTVVVPSNGDAGNETLTIAGTAGETALTADVEMNVANTLIVPIASGTGVGAHVFPTRNVKVGTLVRILNSDAEEHAIHSGAAAAGFPHQDNSMATGQSYDFTFTLAGSFSYYCHDHGQVQGTGSFVVQ